MNKIDIRAYILPHKLLWIGWAVDMTKNNDEGVLYCGDTPLISVKSSNTPCIIGVKFGLTERSVYNKLVKLIDRYCNR